MEKILSGLWADLIWCLAAGKEGQNKRDLTIEQKWNQWERGKKNKSG